MTDRNSNNSDNSVPWAALHAGEDLQRFLDELDDAPIELTGDEMIALGEPDASSCEPEPEPLYDHDIEPVDWAAPGALIELPW